MGLLNHALFRAADLAGVAVFAASGVLAAGRKRLDLFGVGVTALVTAIGGGTLRDVLLGRPVFWIGDGTYLPVIVAASGLTVLYTRSRVPPLRFMLGADALGLALFSVTGAQSAQAAGAPWTVVLLMGVITGVAGGMVRDILCNEIPLVLQGGTLYATAAIGGAGAYYVLQRLGVPQGAAAGLGMLVVFTLRVISIAFGIRLPEYILPEGDKARRR